MYFTETYAQKIPLLPECPVNSVSPTEIDVSYAAGQVYPSISVSTLNNCTNYLISNSYYWMSYVQSGLTVTVSVTNNSGYTPRSGCLNIGSQCVLVSQGCNLLPDDAGTISGTSSVCQGQGGVIYSVPTIAYATGYSWSLPSGASITAGANTNQITVSFNNSATSGNIIVHGTNSCGVGYGGNSPNFEVEVNPLPVAPVGAISSKNSVCQNAGGTMILTAIAGSGTTLRWLSGNCGVNGVTLGTGNNLVVSVPTTYTTTYYARWENSCGNSTCASVTVTVNPTPHVSIKQFPRLAIIGEDYITLESLVTNGGEGYPSYNWTGPNNFASSNHDAEVGIYEDWDPLGPYYLTYTSAQGCVSNTAYWNLRVTGGGLKSAIISNPNIESYKDQNNKDFTIYPNPTTGIINITSNQTGNIDVTVYNNLGKPLFTRFNVNTIDLSGYLPGMYLIKLKTNEKEITQIINLK